MKLLNILAITILTAGLLSACGTKQEPVMTESPATPVQTETSISQITSPDTTQLPSQSPDNAFIGEERAHEIALEKAGLTAADVIFDRTELDRDDGAWRYEIEFRQGRIEYDAEIKADDGTILKWEVDRDD